MKRKNRIILWIAGSAAAVTVGWIVWHNAIRSPEWIQGRVECTTYRATTRMAGCIDRINVKEGQWVEAGELLYTLSTPELEATIRQVEHARNVASAIDCALDVGARRHMEVTALRQWQQAQAGEELGRKNYEHIERLCREGIVTERKRDEALEAFKHLSSIAESARIHYKLIAAGTCHTAGGTEHGIPEIDLRTYMSDAAVYAPIAGEVAHITSGIGEFVGLSTPVLTILDLSDQWVQFNILETRLTRFDISTEMEGYVPALNCPVSLEVKFISPKADFTTWSETHAGATYEKRTFIVKMHARGCPQLRPGMSVLLNWRDIR